MNPKHTQELNRESIVSPYGTPLSATVDFSGDIFCNSDMNLHVYPHLFAFNLKSKFLHLFVEKIESTKYLKISLHTKIVFI